jgi:hypothetical protein
VTRFSGRPAPLHPGGIRALPDEVTREAYSHEVSSAGFWPGGGGTGFPAFYSYAYPTPKGFNEAQPTPKEAYFDQKLSEFLLPTGQYGNRVNPRRRSCHFLRALIAPQPISAVGIDRLLNVRLVSLGDLER